MSLLTLLDLYTFVQILVFWCFGEDSNHGTSKKKSAPLFIVHLPQKLAALDWTETAVKFCQGTQRCSNQQNPICTWYFGSEFKEMNCFSWVNFPTGKALSEQKSCKRWRRHGCWASLSLPCLVSGERTNMICHHCHHHHHGKRRHVHHQHHGKRRHVRTNLICLQVRPAPSSFTSSIAF